MPVFTPRRIHVTIKEDALRASQYGRTAYYQAITQMPSYQAELARVRTDYNERTWIDFSGFLPKFTTAEFEKRREQYQARYGNKVNIPGFSDVIHIIPKARISAEERAAHIWALKRELPSPLTNDQQQSLKYKKFRFLKALASATPAWLKNYGAVATVLDNVEDGLVTVSVLGRVAAKIAPRLMGRMIPGVGWILLGSDILNALNMISWVSFAAKKAKRNIEDLAGRNPFHSKAALNRAFKLGRAVPSFGEVLEILQTTDQLFGVGLCLGGFMGIVTDITSKVMTYSHQENYATMPKTGNIDELTRWANKGFASDVDKFKKTLSDQWTNFKDEAYRLKKTDIKLRDDIMKIAKETEGIVWDKIKSIPQKASSWFSNTLIGSMIMSTGKDDFLKEDHTKAFMMLNPAIEGLMSWWIENDPLEAFKDIRSFKFRAPEPSDPFTIEMLEERSLTWRSTVKWPHLDKEFATIEEIVFAYAPLIKDSFQTYALNYSREWEAMIAGQQVVEFTKNVLRSFSDDHKVKVGMSAWWAVAEDMAREVYLIPPDAPAAAIAALAEYIGAHERQTGGAPSIHDVAKIGTSVGIKWMRTFPRRAFDQAAEIFPEWQAIQDQLDEIFVAD